MIFNSIPFAVFFVSFFILYWFVFKENLKLQNLLILLGSYVFYGWWDWRFLTLLIGSSLLNYYIGIYIARTSDEKRKKWLLYTGLVLGLAGLIFFKYYNFFVTSFVDAFSIFNVHLEMHTLHIILPLGISFYTFRTMSYLLDVDKGKIKPCTDLIVFLSYVAFFPSLVSGPIDKAKLLIPQLEKKRIFNYPEITDGMRQILWGLFKKIVIADTCADYSSAIFDHSSNFSGSTLLLGALFFTFQLYADFSGYSDMAIGFSRLIGFNITQNFNFPFFSQNIAEYWRRWHMSLTSWFTEYVFTPLSISFRDYGKPGLALAIIINFTICGIWHGANWTYALFGFLHGLYFIPLIIRETMNKKIKASKTSLLPTLAEAGNILKTFILVMLTNIVFRADSVSNAGQYIAKIFSPSLLTAPDEKAFLNSNTHPGVAVMLIVFFMLVEWFGRSQQYAIAKLGSNWYRPARWAFYYLLVLSIFLFTGKEQQFIYFKF